MTGEVLRTPDERFADLPGFPFEPRYTEVASLRMHYVDEGPRDGEPVLLLHGEPTWSYLYRKVIPVLVDAGYRAVAPDYIGFGRSDKPADRSAYTYANHVAWTGAFVDALDLRDITLVGQDWGGLIGLRLLADDPARYARVVAANTALPTGDDELPEVWHRFKDATQRAEHFDTARFVKAGLRRPAPPEVLAAYDAPFPDEAYKAGARQFPAIVPIRPEDPATEPNRRAWQTLERWERPFLCAFSDGDPIMAGQDEVFIARVPGAKGLDHPTIRDAGHFLQEDAGEELGEVIVEFLRTTP
jgi:haloalkane dehalogenase